MTRRLLVMLCVATLVLFGLWAIGCSRRPESDPRRPQAAPAGETTVSSMRTYTKPPTEELRRKLTPMQFHVSQEGGTEPAFKNELWDNHATGIYVDVATGEPLFSSLDKFDSGTGWPSFTKPIEDGRVVSKVDRSYGMLRTEVRSSAGDSHLGHVFEDGPPPTGLRYCINSASLRFVAVETLATEGYDDYGAAFKTGAKPPPAKTDNACAPGALTASSAGAATSQAGEKKASCNATVEEAVLAGGCFWGMEDILRKIPGVLETEVGYAGGTTASPTYEDVKTGRSGHAESVRVVFDPRKLSYAELLEKWFFRMHDPTTENRQGNDVGTQYRSIIFTSSPEQKRIAEEIKARVQASGKWTRPIVTQIVPAGAFAKAEDYHQDYLQKHPSGYTCHFLRD